MTMPHLLSGKASPAFKQQLLGVVTAKAPPFPGPQPSAPLTGYDACAYFPNEAVLAEALWRTALTELEQRAADLSLSQENPVESIKALGTAYARFAMDKPTHFQDLFRLDNGHLAAELYASPSPENAYRLLLDWVKQAIDRGQLRRDDPELIAQTLWAGIHGVFSLANSWSGFPFRAQEELFFSIFEMLMVGILADPERSGS